MGNLENFLLLRSLRTLELRVSRQSESASKIAKFLSRHSLVLAAYHPSLSSHPGHKLCKEQMRGPPPVLSFLVPPKLVEEILKNFKIIKSATSLGGKQK
jgi:cystathionine beta-lyase/cystathionine gamma-synthase